MQDVGIVVGVLVDIVDLREEGLERGMDGGEVHWGGGGWVYYMVR